MPGMTGYELLKAVKVPYQPEIMLPCQEYSRVIDEEFLCSRCATGFVYISSFIAVLPFEDLFVILCVGFSFFTSRLSIADDLCVWLCLNLQAETSAFKDIPVVIMSSENDSNRIERYTSITFAVNGFSSYFRTNSYLVVCVLDWVQVLIF